MRNHLGPYNAPAYDNEATVFIDTIVYDKKRANAAVFVIVKCVDNVNGANYNGIVHFAHQENDTLIGQGRWMIYSNHAARHILAEKYDKMSNILRENNFIARSYEAYQRDEIGYNVDDCRFWASADFLTDIRTGGYVEF